MKANDDGTTTDGGASKLLKKRLRPEASVSSSNQDDIHAGANKRKIG